MRKKKSNKFIIILVLLLGIGFAYLSATFNLNGTFNFRENTFNVYLTNVLEEPVNTVEALVPLTITSSTTVSFGAELPRSNDFYTFYVDVVNDGSIDAMVDKIYINGLSDDLKKYLDITIRYKEGNLVNQYDYLRAGATEKLEVTVAQVNDVFDDSDGSLEEVNLELCVDYVIAKDNLAHDHSNIVKGDGSSTWDEVTFNGEPFVVLSNDGNEATLLAKHNLFVGMYSVLSWKNEYTTFADTSSPFYGIQAKTTDFKYHDSKFEGYNVPFSSSKYWTNQTDINNNIYNSTLLTAPDIYDDYDDVWAYHSYRPRENGYGIAYYVKNYENYLESIGIDVIDSFIPTKAMYEDLGIQMNEDNDYYQEKNKLYPYLFNSSYWLSTANVFTDTEDIDYENYNKSVLVVEVTNYSGYISVYYNPYYVCDGDGVRPVIKINSDLIK